MFDLGRRIRILEAKNSKKPKEHLQQVAELAKRLRLQE
jgi:hypothetical protein